MLLVDDQNNKLAKGTRLREVLIQGSLERLNTISMTAFASALRALLVFEGGLRKDI